MMSPLGWRISRARIPVILEILDRSGALADLDRWFDDDKRNRARTWRAPYNARSFLAVLLMLAFAQQPMTLANMFKVLWFDLEPDVLDELGVTGVVNPDRRAALGEPDLQSAAWRAEYEHFQAFSRDLFGLVDPSPHKQHLRQTNAQLQRDLDALTEEQRARLDRNHERLLTVVNKIVATSAHYAGERLEAATGRNWLTDWKGDVAIDGHMVAVAKAMTPKPTAPNSLHGYDPDSGFWPKHRDLLSIWGHQITLGVAVTRTYQRQVPHLALSMAIGKPSGGDVGLTRQTLEALQRYGPKATTNSRPRLICDQGFTHLNGYATTADLLGYDLVMEYAKGRTVQQDLGNGAYLYNGVPVCPEYLARLKAQQPDSLPETHEKLTDDEFWRQAEFERLAHAARMRLNGRWRPTSNEPNWEIDQNGRRVTLAGAKAGRPRKHSSKTEQLFVTQVECPASTGPDDPNRLCRSRCTRVEATLQRLDLHSFPTAATDPLRRHPDGSVDTNGLPHACQFAKSSARLDAKGFKQAQRYMRGTWQHSDIYQTARSANERWHSQLKHRSVGAFTKDSRHMTGTARVAIISMSAVVVTNIVIGEAFARRVKHNGGKPPACTRVAERAARERREHRLRNEAR